MLLSVLHAGCDLAWYKVRFLKLSLLSLSLYFVKHSKSDSIWLANTFAVVIDGKDKHFVSSMQCSFSFSDVIVDGNMVTLFVITIPMKSFQNLWDGTAIIFHFFMAMVYKAFENFLHTTLPVSRTSFKIWYPSDNIRMKSLWSTELLTNWLWGELKLILCR